MKVSVMRKHINKRGNEFVEASIVIPIVLFCTVILLRFFSFSFELLMTGTMQHEKLLSSSLESSGTVDILPANHSMTVRMFPVPMLSFIPEKTIEASIYNYDEDAIIRIGELVSE